MHWFKQLFSRRRRYDELSESIREHLDEKIADLMDRGMTREQAEQAARREFGNVTRIEERSREVWQWTTLESIWADIKLALRQIRVSPGFAAATICTLALGIGVNIAIFDVLNGVLLQPLPYRDPSQLVAIQQTLRTGGFWTFSYPDYRDYSTQSKAFESIAAWRNEGATLTSPGEPTFLPIRQISGTFLDVLGIQPILGRNFRSSDDDPGSIPVAIIDYSFWQQRFGGRQDIIGTTMNLNGISYTVIGVLPSGFRFLDSRSILIPIGQDKDIIERRDLHPGIYAIARLKPGIDLQNANSELRVIGERLAYSYPNLDSRYTGRAVPLRKDLVGDIGPKLFMLSAAVGLVLLIACVNVANLFLARTVARQREFAIRAALGAGRWRLTRQLLTESILLSFIGGVIGVAIAALGTGWAISVLPNWLPAMSRISLDVRVLIFALGISVLCGILFGSVPAFQRRSNLEIVLREGARGSSSGATRIQKLFIVAEITLAFVLLTSAGLMLRTILRLWNISPGFDSHNLLTMEVALPPTDVSNATLIRNSWVQMLTNVRETPGVEAAALDSIIPVTGDTDQLGYWTSTETTPPQNMQMAFLFTPTPDYLNTMKIPLLGGRFFTDQDRVGSEPVIVIDETFAKRLFPDRNPVGESLSIQFIGRVRVVGVVGAVKHRSLDENSSTPSEPAIYVPFLQFPDSFMSITTSGMHLLIRTPGNPAGILKAVKQATVGPTQNVSIRDVTTMDQLIGSSIAQRKGIGLLLAIFAALALLLSAIGIYSVISYAMSQRVQEIGIRMALGAQRSQVIWMVLRESIRIAGIGVVLGVVASFATTRLMVALLFHTSPNDPLTFVGVAAVLSVVAIAATYLPAHRASTSDPMQALRSE